MIPRLMPSRRRARLLMQALESRTVPATFTVSNVADAGAASLRQAIIDSNAAAGADSIVFEGAIFASAQTISLLSALPNTPVMKFLSSPSR